VQRAEIAWITCRALRTWASRLGGRLIRRQEVQRAGFLLESELYDRCCGWWCARAGRAPRRFVVSHAWLSKEHPDPDGSHLQELVAELDQLGARDEDVAFFDFCSPYQTDLCHPDMLALEDGERLRAMHMMHELYTFYKSEIVVLPSVPDDAANSIPYLARGWCFFEFAISADHWRLLNVANSEVRELLDTTGAPWDESDFITEFATKRFTNQGDSTTVMSLYEHLYESEPGRNAREVWLGMGWLGLMTWVP